MTGDKRLAFAGRRLHFVESDTFDVEKHWHPSDGFIWRHRHASITMCASAFLPLPRVVGCLPPFGATWRPSVDIDRPMSAATSDDVPKVIIMVSMYQSMASCASKTNI